MKNFYKLIGIICMLTLLASCAINFEFGGGDRTDSKEKTEKPVAEKTCQGSGEPCGKCAAWKEPDKINPYCGKVGSFLDKDIKALEKTAWDAYKAKDYEKAAKYYLAFLRHNVTDERNIYNLACCYGLLGKSDLAAKYVERAYKTGFGDINWIKEDPDFDKVRESEVFTAAIAKLEEELKAKKSEKGELVYIKSESLVRCYINLPEGYDAEKSHTLVMGLHGYGSTPEGFSTLYGRFENPDFIYTVPQAPYPFIEGSGYSWGPHGELEPIWQESNQLTAGYVADVIGYMKENYKIGDIYLLGFSQGGHFTYKTGIKNHELLKGIIPMGAWFEDEWFEKLGIDLGAANHLRVFIGHGTEDEIVKIKGSEQARDKLGEFGYNITYYTFEGGHTLPAKVLLEVQKWIKDEDPI